MPRLRIRFGEGDVYHVRVELGGLLPVVWRRVEVSRMPRHRPAA